MGGDDKVWLVVLASMLMTTLLAVSVALINCPNNPMFINETGAMYTTPHDHSVVAYACRVS